MAVRFAVVADGVVTRRPIRLLGLDAVLALHPTLDDALRAVRREDRSSLRGTSEFAPRE